MQICVCRFFVVSSDICLSCGHSPVAPFAPCSPYARRAFFYGGRTVVLRMRAHSAYP